MPVQTRRLIAAALPLLLFLGGAQAVFGLGRPLMIQDITPRTALPGETLTVRILGQGFSATDDVDFGEGITVNSIQLFTPDITILSDHELSCSITVANGAEIGPRDVFVTNEEGAEASMEDGFFVAPQLTGGELKARSSLKFGTARVGRGKTKQLKVQNKGSEDLTLYLHLPEPFFSENDGLMVLGPRESVKIPIEFDPEEGGNYQMVGVLLSSDPNNSTLLVDLLARAR